MKKFAAALVATAFIASGAVAVTAPPAAASKGTVTQPEFRKAKKGMTNDRVHQIFNTRGKTTFQGYGYMDREYKTRNRYGFVFVSYERRNGDWKLISKSAYWG